MIESTVIRKTSVLVHICKQVQRKLVNLIVEEVDELRGAHKRIYPTLEFLKCATLNLENIRVRLQLLLPVDWHNDCHKELHTIL